MIKLRIAFLAVAVLLLLMMSWGEAGVMLALFVAADLGAAALMLRSEETPHGFKVVRLGSDADSLVLLRRVVPELRMRRPALAINAQIEWRQAAEARRRRREFAFALRRD